MRLRAVAGHFDRTQCRDAYTGKLLFSGQFMLYDDTRRDSEASERRVLSVSPKALIPARRVVEAAGTRWIVGHSNVDSFQGRPLRVGYVAHEAPTLATVYSLDGITLNTPTLSAYCGRAWLKDLAYSEQSSHLSTEYHFHFAAPESVTPGDLILLDGEYHVVRATNKGAGGTLVVNAERLDGPVVDSAVIPSTQYDPVTQAWSGPGTTVRVIRLRWQSLFQYLSPGAPTFGPGDAQLAVSKSLLTPAVGMSLTLSDGRWQIASFYDHRGVWLCRGVKHA